MQRWLEAKVEEDRRCQEEEKTRQETIKLERRKVDHAIFVDALRAGVPPHLAPLVFGGMDRPADGKSVTPELLQYMADMMLQYSLRSHQPQAHPSASQPATLPSLSRQFCTPPTGEPTRKPRSTLSNTYMSPVQHQLPGTKQIPSHLLVGGSDTGSGGRTSFVSTVSTSNNGQAVNLPRPMEINSQSRSSAVFHPLHSIGPQQPPSNHPPPPRSQQEPRPRRPSPSISFHHWTPPDHSQPHALSSRAQEDHVLPSNGSGQTHAEIQGSPGRKRKSSSTHAQLPPPSSRSSVATEGSFRYGRQSSAGSQSGQASGHGDSRRHSDVSATPRETPATEKDYHDHPQIAEQGRALTISSNAAEYHSHPRRRRSTGESLTREVSNRGSDREDQSQYSSRGPMPDTRDNPGSSLDTGNGTRSSAMTDWAGRE